MMKKKCLRTECYNNEETIIHVLQSSNVLDDSKRGCEYQVAQNSLLYNENYNQEDISKILGINLSKINDSNIKDPNIDTANNDKNEKSSISHAVILCLIGLCAIVVCLALFTSVFSGVFSKIGELFGLDGINEIVNHNSQSLY